MYALGGIGRGGMMRAGYHSPHVFISIAGNARRHYVRHGSLSVRDALNERPNTALLTVDTLQPTKGDEVIVTLGTINRLTKLFAGHALTPTQIYEGKPANLAWQLSCTDYTWRFNSRQVTKRYQSMSASLIAIDLVETYAPGFDTSGIVLGLDSLDEITFTNADLADCLTQITRRIGGYWKVDYRSGPRILLWVTSTLQAPVTLIAGPTARFRHLQFTEDLSGVITRVYGEGGGANALSAIALGETIIPVEAAEWYGAFGGTIKSGPQVIAYAGRTLGGGGTLVGPGAAPAAAPNLALASGSGVESGSHDYAVTFVTAAGESMPGPLASITPGLVTPPSSAPSAGSPTSGGSIDDGTHDYVVTFLTSAGQTTPSPISGQQTTQADVGEHYVTEPTSTGTAVQASAAEGGTSEWSIGDQVYFKLVYVNAAGTTTPGSQSNTVTATTDGFGNARLIRVDNIPVSSDPSVTAKRLYRNVNGGWDGYHSFPNAWQSFTDGSSNNAGSPPGSNTAFVAGADYQTIPLTDIPTGPAAVTSRKLWRRFNGTGAFKELHQIVNNEDTSWTDTLPNSSLGADAPTSNTAAVNQVALSSIPIGAAAVTARNIYRTPLDSSQLKLQSTIANNTATTATDSTADASLGANVPTSDTSGLTQPEGQVSAGSITLLVAGTAAFSASGGWAVTGNGQQVIRYTGIAGSSLTGIPASGPGAISTSIAYNSTVTAAPQIIGVPASGVGAVQYPMLRGDPVNIFVQRDDAAAQATLAALIGGGFDGVREDNVQDRRLSEDEIIARCDALLEKRKDARAELRYQTQDVTTQSGAQITVNVTDPTNISGVFTIQEVTIGLIQESPLKVPKALPWYSVVASDDHFSLEDLLRQRRAA